MSHEEDLTGILKSDASIMHILRTVRGAHVPNWYVGAGVIRNAVWDRLHGKPNASPIRDIDCIYYSLDDLDEDAIKEYLRNELPNVDWDIKNSRHVHEWYKTNKNIDRPQLSSSEEDIRQWPEIVTCIGVRLLDDDSLYIYAPYGLDDLMNMVWRPNLHKTYRSPEFAMKVFEERVIAKNVIERWPKVRIEYA